MRHLLPDGWQETQLIDTAYDLASKVQRSARTQGYAISRLDEYVRAALARPEMIGDLLRDRILDALRETRQANLDIAEHAIKATGHVEDYWNGELFVDPEDRYDPSAPDPDADFDARQ